ncbi:alpha/beta hydrolase family protein [Geodermatophilus sp. CPCC 205761]
MRRPGTRAWAAVSALLAVLVVVGVREAAVAAGTGSGEVRPGPGVAAAAAPAPVSAGQPPLARLEHASIGEDTISGRRVLTVTSTRPVSGPRPVALMLHGAGHDRRVPVEESAQRFTQTLIDAGWVVAASDAGGDAWGSSASQADHLSLLDRLREVYPVSGVVLVSMSMGGVAGLNMVADGSVPDLLGWVGITAVTNLRAVAADPRFTDRIAGALSAGEIAARDPLALPADQLGGVPLVAVVSPSDPWTPPVSQLTPFAEHMGAVNPPRVVECSDGHLGVDCYRADVVMELVAG